MFVIGFIAVIFLVTLFAFAPVIATIATLIIILGIRGISLGYKQKNVFYHSLRDVIDTALVTWIFGVGGLAWLYQDIQYQTAKNLDPIHYSKSDWLGWTVSISILSIFFLYNLIKTLKYNKNVFGAICVFCGRVIMGLSSALFLITASSLYGDSRPKQDTQTAAKSLIGLLTTLGMLAGYVELTKRLINKDTVKVLT